MEIIIQKDEHQVAALAAKIVANNVRKKPDSALGLPCGRSMTNIYKELVRLHREEGLDFSKIRAFSLDEYVGLEVNHPLCFRISGPCP